MDADLANAITQVLGLKATLVNATFDTIIPGLQSGKYDMGDSSFTDTLARQKVVDFVDLLPGRRGFLREVRERQLQRTRFAVRSHRVRSRTARPSRPTPRLRPRPAPRRARQTVTVLSYGNQSEANLAVSSGRAQVGFADSQVAAYIVATSNGVFMNSGQAFEVAPYGFALPKGNGMAAPVKAAVNLLISNGVYMKILTKWGVQAGAVTHGDDQQRH